MEKLFDTIVRLQGEYEAVGRRLERLEQLYDLLSDDETRAAALEALGVDAPPEQAAGFGGARLQRVRDHLATLAPRATFTVEDVYKALLAHRHDSPTRVREFQQQQQREIQMRLRELLKMKEVECVRGMPHELDAIWRRREAAAAAA